MLGLCVGLFETISPKELYAALAKIRGNKFVLLDACHTLDANFLEGVPENTLVVTGQDKAKHVLYDAHVTRLFSLDGKDFASLYAGSKVTGGLLTAAFLRALEENAGAVDLKHVLPKVMEGYHRIASHNVEVHVEGKTVRMGHK
jgi:endo-1,4-beta-mannosidase